MFGQSAPSSFLLPRLERVISGPGTLETLPPELDRYGSRRAVIVTGATLGGSPLVARVAAMLQNRCVSVFTGARQHVPASTVAALLQAMQAVEADSLVSVGGGSPIDTAKCAVHALITGRVPRTAETRGQGGDNSPRLPDSVVRGSADAPVHVAIPTTLSAGEFTDVAGMTDEGTLIKHARRDTRLAPRSVITDPVLTLETPEWLWAASGIRALDHAIETLYSHAPHVISQTLAARAIQMLVTHLPLSVRGAAEDILPQRSACQMAAWLAVFGVTNAGFGLSHVLGHQIGPRWNVPHGVTSAVMLPHAMRFMAEAAPSRFAEIARALDVPFDGDNPRPSALACADRTAEFISRFGLPARLSDAGVPRDGLAPVAGLVSALMQDADVVARPVNPEDVESILAAAY
jgi:alcohol dehydrogenase